MPLGPSAEELEVGRSASATAVAVMAMNVRRAAGGGSLGWEAETGGGRDGKNRSQSMVTISAGCCAVLLPVVRGGIFETHRPCRQ